MKRLGLTSLCNNSHIYLFICIAFIISFIHVVGVVFLVGLVIVSRKLISKVLLGILLILLSLSLLYFSYVPKSFDAKGIIISVNEAQYSNLYIIKVRGKKYEFYHRDLFEVNDKIQISATVEKFSGPTIKNGFNSLFYKNSQNIKGKLNIENITLIKHQRGYHYFLAKLKSKNILVVDFLFGDFKTPHSNLQFLFSVSFGVVVAFYQLIKKVFFHLNVEQQTQQILLVIISLLFAIVINSVFFWLYLFINLLHAINDFLGKPLTKLDVDSIAIIFLVIIHPRFIFSHSLYVFIAIKLFLTLTVHKKVKSDIIIAAVLIPFFILWSNKVSIAMLLLAPILFFVIRKNSLLIILILSVVSFININEIIEPISRFVNVVETVFPLSFRVKTFSIYMWLTYYAFLIFILMAKDKKRTYIRSAMVAFSLFLIAFGMKTYTNNYVYFLDVGQGDSAVILHNHNVIVVDAYQNVANYLLTEGISTINYLILTHNDNDHVKEASNLLIEFEVKTLILNEYQDYGLTHLANKTILIGENNLPTISPIGITFLGPIRNYASSNDNSIVFSYENYNTRFLFTGDAESSAEKDLITYYPQVSFDILKVAHHGSKSSTSSEFLRWAQVETAIISAGSNNIYNLPNPQVINRLNQQGIKYWLTSQEGSIKIRFNKQGYYVIAYHHQRHYSIIN